MKQSPDVDVSRINLPPKVYRSVGGVALAFVILGYGAYAGDLFTYHLGFALIDFVLTHRSLGPAATGIIMMLLVQPG